MRAGGERRSASGADRRPGLRSRGLAAALVLAVTVLGLAAPVGAQPLRPAASPVLVSIVQSHPTTENGSVTVSIVLSNVSNVHAVIYQFCELTDPVCFVPSITMTNTTAAPDSFTGTTELMSQYHGMAYGVAAGYNITVFLTNGSLVHYPGPSTQFPGLSVVYASSDEWCFKVVVQDQTFGLQGTVTNSTSGTPLAGATVALSPGTNSTVTNSAGAYSFPGLFNGTYHLSVTDSGYLTQNQTVQIFGQAVTKNLALRTPGSAPPPLARSNGGSSSPLASLTHGVGLDATIGIIVLVVAVAGVLAMRRRPRSPKPAPPVPPSETPAGGPGSG